MSSIISSISSWNPFGGSQDTYPLHNAVKAGDISQIDSLMGQDADITAKDGDGFTAVDHAIFLGKQDELMHLLQKHDAVNEKLIAQTSKEIEKILADKSTKPLKDFFADLGSDELSDENKAILSQHSETLGASAMFNATALLGSEHAIKHLLSQNPYLVNQPDMQGHIPLHYAALNKNEAVFKELLNHGGNIFAASANMATPLGLLVGRIQKEDPLNLSTREIFVFIADWIPTIINNLPSAAKELLKNNPALNLIPGVIQLIGLYSGYRLVKDSFEGGIGRALFTLAYLGMSFTPVLNLIPKAFSTYFFLKNAYQGVKHGINNFGARPLKAIGLNAVRISNATSYAKDFYANLKLADWTIRAARLANRIFGNTSEWEEFAQSVTDTCGPLGEQIEAKDLQGLSTSLPCATELFGKKYMQDADELFPGIGRAWEEAIQPVVNDISKGCLPLGERNPEMAAECAGGVVKNYLQDYLQDFMDSLGTANTADTDGCSSYLTPQGLSGMGHAQRTEAVLGALTSAGIDATKQDTADSNMCAQAALDMFNTGYFCELSKRQVKSLSRKIYIEVHPDKHLGEPKFQGISTAFNNAKEFFVRKREELNCA